MRQRIDEGADLYLPYVQKAAVDVLLSAKAPVGQLGLNGYAQRHPTKRRRIRTVIQELLYVAARVIRSGRESYLQFGKRCRVFDRLLDQGEGLPSASCSTVPRGGILTPS